MKVKTITLEGDTGFMATISRECENKVECIFCDISDAEGETVAIHHVDINDRDDQWSMAECIQYQLDGCRGTNSMINDYLREIERFAD